jgi:hypothetical protein
MWINTNGNTSAARPTRFRLESGLTATNLTDLELLAMGWSYQEDTPTAYMPPNEGQTVDWIPGFDVVSTSTQAGEVL